MAQKKGGGSTRNGRDSKPKMLGVKAFGGELISAGSIIVRQRGTKFHAGNGVGTVAVDGSGLQVRFGSAHAVRGVSFHIDDGETAHFREVTAHEVIAHGTWRSRPQGASTVAKAEGAKAR